MKSTPHGAGIAGVVPYDRAKDVSTGGDRVKATQRSALREAGFTEPQTNALAMALEPLATKEDLSGAVGLLRNDLEGLRKDLEVLRVDLRWMKWVGGAIGLTVLTEMVSGFFS